MPAAHTTIAVLPVACAAGDEYLAEGLLDDLIDTLASSGTLRVRPAGSVRAGGDPDPRQLGRALDVDHVVIAALRRSPAGLRVSARLISVADGFQIWAFREDCSESEILAAADRSRTTRAGRRSATRSPGAPRPCSPRSAPHRDDRHRVIDA